MEQKSNNYFKYQIFGLIAIFGVVISLAGYYYYHHEKNHNQLEKYDELKAIAKLKANQLIQWHKERLSEANYFTTSIPASQYEVDIIQGKSNKNKLLRSTLLRIMTNKRYENIYLLNKFGKKVFSVLPENARVDTESLGHSKEVMKIHQIKISDFYYCKFHRKVHFEILAPVFDKKNAVIGTLVFKINPADFLYPLIQEWPIPKKTAETVIVRQEGDSVRFLSPLKHRSNDSLQVVFSKSNLKVLAVQAVLGKTGIFEGIDYAGNKVLGDLSKVAGTPWYMIVKIDTKEMYADLNKQFLLIIIIVFLSLLFVGTSIGWYYFNRQRKVLKELLNRKSQLHQSQEEFGAILYSMGDGVITTDLKGQVKKMNSVAERLTGWVEQNAKGKNNGEIFKIRNEETNDQVESPVDIVLNEGKRVSYTNYVILISKDNNEMPVDVSVSPIKDNNGNLLGVVMVFSDKTEERLRRKLVEIRLRIFEYAIHHSLRETLKFILDEIGQFTNSQHCFINFINPEKKSIWIKNWSTLTEKELHQNEVSDLNLSQNETEIWVECLRLKKPLVYNKPDNLTIKKVIAESLEKISKIMLVPVFRNQQIVAVLGIGNRQADYTELDVETVSYLADVALEVIEIKTKEESLKQSEDTIRQFFNSTAEGIFGIDKLGINTFCNKATLEILGYDDEQEILGKNMHQLMHHSHKDDTPCPEEQCKIFNAFREGVPMHADDDILRKKNGKYFPAEYWSFPIIRDNKTIGSVVKFIDISQRKYNEDVQQILYDIAKSSMSSKTIEDLLKIVRDELNKVMDTSNFYVALYNQETETLNKVFCQNEKNSLDQWELENTLSGQVFKTGQTILLNKENRTSYLMTNGLIQNGPPAESWLGVPLLENQKVIGVMVAQSYTHPNAFSANNARLMNIVAHELTIAIQRNKMIEDLIYTKEKAEESDHLKTAFLANMSHEIRTPMNGILGFLDLLNEPDLDEKKRKDYIEIVNKSSQRLLETINDIIEISKIEVGETEINTTIVDTSEIMEFFYDFFKLQTEKKDLDFKIAEMSTGPSAIIFTDRQKLESIMTNLIRNAIKFTTRGGIEIGNYIENDHLYFYVKDSGRGIPTERLEAIFDRFVQADLKLTRDHEGSGLGLSIVKAYVKSLGGKIFVESELGIGSKFTFSIPYSPATEKIEIINPILEDVNKQKKDMTILIAEDDESSYILLEIALSKQGYYLLHTVNGEDTVKAIQENPDIAIILMDLKMPGMDGLEAMNKIRQFNKEIPIIAQTAYAFSNDKENSFKAGCNEFITKPIKYAELFGIIDKYLKK